MRKIILAILMAIVISSIAAASALFIYNLAFLPQNTISTCSSPENGAITIAFDDGWFSEYKYAWPLMNERKMVGTFYIISGLIGDINRMGRAELLDLQKHGCEIASHSHIHPDFTTLSESEIRDECVTSKEILESYGLRINNFAYPQGKSDTYIDSIVDDYYRSGRYGWGIMQFPVSTFKVLGYSPYSDSDDFTLLKNKVDEVYEKKGWTIIYFHQVLPEKRGSDVSTADFEKFLDYIMQKGVAVITVNQGLDIGSIGRG